MVLNGSKTDEEAPYPTTAKLVVVKEGAANEETATGVFISKNILLTAAHSITSNSRETTAATIDVTAEFNDGRGGYFEDSLIRLERADEAEDHLRLHPDYDPSTGENDIAVIRTDRHADYTAPILTHDTLTTMADPFAGTAGYGLHLVGGVLLKNPDEALHARQFIAATAADVATQKPEFYDPDSTGISLAEALHNGIFYVSNVGSDDHRMGPCPGDSGAGVFLGKPEASVSNPNASGVSHLLIGLVSHSSLPKPPRNTPQTVRIDHYRDTKLAVACTNLVKEPQRAFIETAIESLDGKQAVFL